MRRWVLLLSLLASSWLNAEIDETALLRTIQLGTAHELELADLIEAVHDDRLMFHHHVLARGALLVLDRDRDFPGWPPARLLDRLLDQLTPGTAFSAPEGNFRNDQVVHALVYAMVMSGRADEAIEVLEQHSDSRVPFKRATVLQALRNIGSDAAGEVLQLAASGNGQDDNLAANLLADYHYPFLHELASRAGAVPTDQRQQALLIDRAQDDPCSIGAGMAVYYLGFFGPGASDAKYRDAIALLRELAGIDCHYTRFFARRSLAMRSPEDLNFWIDMYVDERDAWQRAQLARILYIHYPQRFPGLALDLLASEGSQYVQWELMHGLFESGSASAWLNYWDLWLPPTVQFRLDHADSVPIGTALSERLLDWLDAGYRPLDPWVRNHLLYRLAGNLDAYSVDRYLDVFEQQPEFGQNWWVLQALSQPEALPRLIEWRNRFPASEDPGPLVDAIDRLEAANDLTP